MYYHTIYYTMYYSIYYSIYYIVYDYNMIILSVLTRII